MTVVHVDMENVLASVASAVRGAKGTAQAFRQHGRHGSDTRYGAARGRRAAEKTALFPPVRPVPPRLRVEPARADALGCGAPFVTCGTRRALMGSPGSEESARDRNARRPITASRRPPIPGSGVLSSGTHRCASATSSGAPDRAGRRHGGIGGPKAFPILPCSVSRNNPGRAESAESSVMIAMGPPRRDRHQRRDRYFLDTKRKIQ